MKCNGIDKKNTNMKPSSDPTSNEKRVSQCLEKWAQGTHLVELAQMPHSVFLTFDEMSVKVGDDSCKHNGLNWVSDPLWRWCAAVNENYFEYFPPFGLLTHSVWRNWGYFWRTVFATTQNVWRCPSIFHLLGCWCTAFGETEGISEGLCLQQPKKFDVARVFSTFWVVDAQRLAKLRVFLKDLFATTQKVWRCPSIFQLLGCWCTAFGETEGISEGLCLQQPKKVWRCPKLQLQLLQRFRL